MHCKSVDQLFGDESRMLVFNLLSTEILAMMN